MSKTSFYDLWITFLAVEICDGEIKKTEFKRGKGYESLCIIVILV